MIFATLGDFGRMGNCGLCHRRLERIRSHQLHARPAARLVPSSSWPRTAASYRTMSSSRAPPRAVSDLGARAAHHHGRCAARSTGYSSLAGNRALSSDSTSERSREVKACTRPDSSASTATAQAASAVRRCRSSRCPFLVTTARPHSTMRDSSPLGSRCRGSAVAERRLLSIRL